MNCEDVTIKLEAEVKLREEEIKRVEEKFKESMEAFGREGKKATDALTKEIEKAEEKIDDEIDKLNLKCKARNIRRKKTEAELQKEIDDIVKETNKLKLRMAQVATTQGHQGEEIQEHSEELQGHDVRITALEQSTGKILTGEVMMKNFLHRELGEEFLTTAPTQEPEAKADVKLCRDTIAAYFDNVNTNWPDADMRHFDAFWWVDPENLTYSKSWKPKLISVKKIIDFMHDQEALKPIVDKWQWQEVE